MKVEGNLSLSVTPEKLWELLQDPEFLKEVMPGCKELNPSGEDQFTGIIEARVGSISSQYTAKFSIQDKNPPSSYRLHLEGNGKGGFVRSDTNVILEANGNETILKYEGDVAIGGTIARIGQRLVDVAAKMLINKGFQKLKEKVEDRVQK